MFVALPLGGVRGLRPVPIRGSSNCGNGHPITKKSLVFLRKWCPAFGISEHLAGMASLIVVADQKFEVGSFRLVCRLYIVMGIAQHFVLSNLESSLRPSRSSTGMIHAEHSLIPTAATRAIISSRSAGDRRASLQGRSNLLRCPISLDSASEAEICRSTMVSTPNVEEAQTNAPNIRPFLQI